MWFGVITLFPEMLTTLQFGVTGRAIERGIIDICAFNPRDHTTNKHQTVDDKPYGGGPGMLMMAPPLKAALQHAKENAPSPAYTVYLSPQGKRFTQKTAAEWTKKKSIILLAGRYEGIDERVKEEIDEEWSIGDFILTGGELAALTMIDTITRLLPDVVGDYASIEQDSLTSGLLKYPQYTRPEVVDGVPAPWVLTSGDHAAIETWRRKQTLGQTWLRRPDLLQDIKLSIKDMSLLDDFIKEFNEKNIDSDSSKNL